MRPPSVLCLRALRRIVYGEVHPCAQLTRRYASTGHQPPPPVTNRPAAFTPPPTTPGYKLRQAGNKDGEFTPTPLSRPIGMPNPPQSGENTGLDKRSLQQRRDDFVNYDKHLQRRAQLTKQIAKPYFRDWSNMKFHQGKQFFANERLFRAEHALFVPNFFGKTLQERAVMMDRNDGYGGLGRSTSDVMYGKVSIMSIVSSTWAEQQVKTFLSKESNPELHAIMQQHKEQAQFVEINREENAMKWLLVQAFRGNLRSTRTPEEQERYFMVHRGVNDIMKEALGLLNDKVGYIYLVDAECRLRWAASARAEGKEIESLNRGVKRLIQEISAPAKHAPAVKLEDAVAGVIH